MAKTRSQAGFCIVLILVGLGCSSRPCREPRMPELDRSAPGAPAPSAAANGETQAGPERVRVFKADGSRQCETNSTSITSPVVMERELAGIKVYSRERRKDGLMHIQVCGSPTGMVNVYEIDQNQLKQAEERGFKKWDE